MTGSERGPRLEKKTLTAGASNQACGPVGRPSIIHKNKTPQIAGSCHSAHRTAGDSGGIGAIRTRLMNVSRASFGEVQRSLAELRVMHRWRTELFRHLVHSLEVDLCVAEQRQIDLSAHRGLRPLRIEPSDSCPADTQRHETPRKRSLPGGLAFLDSNAPERPQE
jgi:hypothetical protein